MKKSEKHIELLAPAGNAERLAAAIHFGADAVYLGGKSYGLRAFSDNFTDAELPVAVDFAHRSGKKVYAALNIFAYNEDFIRLKEYIMYLESIKIDAVIVSDPGILTFVKKYTRLPVHMSTQSNITNKYSALFWAGEGAERIVTARELSLDMIKEIRDALPDAVEIESFVHGAMCISYSGRCLLSNYLASRPSNKGECAQSCRWEYTVSERSRGNDPMPIEQDARGTYIFNSRDLCMLPYIDRLSDAGINSFKIEGRTKTAYYVANTVNCYRRAIDAYESAKKNGTGFILPDELNNEPQKSSNRGFTTGMYFGGKGEGTVELETSKPDSEYLFAAIVTDTADGGVIIEQRGRFKTGERLEVLSPGKDFNSVIEVPVLYTLDGEAVSDAKNVQQRLRLKTELDLRVGDILRKKVQP